MGKFKVSVADIREGLAYNAFFRPDTPCPKCNNHRTSFYRYNGDVLECRCKGCNWFKTWTDWREKDSIIIRPELVCSACGSENFWNSQTEEWVCPFCI